MSITPEISRMKEWPWAGPSDKLINEDSKSNEQLGTCTTWPRITIVTPSLNQGSFIEQSIRSVLLQGYPNLEYFIIDGGSSDETVDLIRKYEPYLAGWVSEHDKGQSNALAKGFANATGDYLGWINADDIYLPGALFAVGHAARRFGNSIIAGNVANMHVESGMQVIISQQNIRLKELLKPWKNSSRYHQPGIFFPRRYYQRIGGINESLRYAMDYDLYCRLLMIPIPVKYIDQVLAQFRLHKSSTVSYTHLTLPTKRIV